jgi:H+/Cl- antiporter ClcA
MGCGAWGPEFECHGDPQHLNFIAFDMAVGTGHGAGVNGTAVVGVGYNLREIPLFVLVGIAGGLFGAFFNKLNIRVNTRSLPPLSVCPQLTLFALN